MRIRHIYIILFYALCFQLFGCDKYPENVKIINVESSISTSPSPKIEIKSIIKLETNDNSLIGEIDRIEYFLGHYYILDRFHSKALLLFNQEGKFISKTKLGKGPGEIINPWDFFIDEINNKVYLWDQSTFRMMEYDLELNYLSHLIHNGLAIRNFIKTKNNQTFVFAQSASETEDETDKNTTYYNYFVYSNNCNQIIKSILPAKKHTLALTLTSPINVWDTHIIFTAPFYPYIYEYSKNKVNEKYFLEFGDYLVTQGEMEKGLSYLFDLARKGERILAIDQLNENQNFLVFSFYLKDRINFFIHSKTENTNYYSQKIFEVNALPYCRLQGLYNDSFIGIINPIDYMKYSNDRNSAFDVIDGKESDNPYIMIFKIEKS